MLHATSIKIIVYYANKAFIVSYIHLQRASKDSRELLAKVEIREGESFGEDGRDKKSLRVGVLAILQRLVVPTIIAHQMREAGDIKEAKRKNETYFDERQGTILRLHQKIACCDLDNSDDDAEYGDDEDEREEEETPDK
ncbi:hypothetical protein VF21_01940 [Pseudogymnoascus sp. 05NY08]|nr:hypothetical protein VF21_01940 [Pseudogymnoascus sp. 05NY08]